MLKSAALKLVFALRELKRRQKKTDSARHRTAFSFCSFCGLEATLRIEINNKYMAAIRCPVPPLFLSETKAYKLFDCELVFELLGFLQYLHAEFYREVASICSACPRDLPAGAGRTSGAWKPVPSADADPACPRFTFRSPRIARRQIRNS